MKKDVLLVDLRDLRGDLELIAEYLDRPLNWVIRLAIREYLDRAGIPEKGGETHDNPN